MILSINPCYVKEIISGKKIYEFRKSKHCKEIQRVYIYETRPTKKIIGYFKYNGIISDDKYNIWDMCKGNAGICKEDYFDYYKHSLKAYAYIIEDFVLLKDQINPYELIEGFTAPQSYRYIKRGIIDELISNLI